MVIAVTNSKRILLALQTCKLWFVVSGREQIIKNKKKEIQRVPLTPMTAFQEIWYNLWEELWKDDPDERIPNIYQRKSYFPRKKQN